MAYAAIEFYSSAMKRDTVLTLILPAGEAGRGELTTPKPLDGIWLLTRPGGLSDDWLLWTRHLEQAGEDRMVVLPPWQDCAGYEEFLTEELPAFLAGFGLQPGAAHNVLGAHPESAAEVERLFCAHPERFGTLLPQPDEGEDWAAADNMLTDYLISTLGRNAIRK